MQSVDFDKGDRMKARQWPGLPLFCLVCLTPSHHSKRKQTTRLNCARLYALHPRFYSMRIAKSTHCLAARFRAFPLCFSSATKSCTYAEFLEEQRGIQWVDFDKGHRMKPDLRLFCLACLPPSHHSKRKQTIRLNCARLS